MKKTTKKLIALICTLIMVTSLFPTMAGAAKVGDVVGYAQPTNIVATINGYQLESYNVEGYTYICVEDLRYYGFDVVYDPYSRTLSVTRNNSVTQIDPQNTNPKFWEIGSNTKRKNILYTDIVTYVNGNYVDSCNINGQTIIRFDNLGAFGEVAYDDSKREISLVVSSINYNIAALYAASMHEQYSNPDWTAIIRAKGDVIMYIGTARSYMNSSQKNYYIKNNFPEDKAGADSILQSAEEQGIPISSVYLELRNSDGSIIATYQTK